MQTKRAGKNMILAGFLYPTGYHIASWKSPRVNPISGFTIESYLEYAKIADEAGLNFIFLPDSNAPQGGNEEILSKSTTQYVAQFEPLTLAGALALATNKVGLVATVSTMYNHPMTVARSTSSLDLISNGRFGWNVVTGQNAYEASAFGYAKQPAHSLRYERAEEFVDVVKALWQTWPDGPPTPDIANGRFYEATSVNRVEHHGAHFDISGRLNVPPSRQSRPVICQAGASNQGVRLAGRTADLVFAATGTMQEAISYRQRVHTAASEAGRPAPPVIAGIVPIIGSTESEANEKRSALDSLVDFDLGLHVLQHQLGVQDLSQFDPDGPLPFLPATPGAKGRQKLLLRLARAEGVTIRDLIQTVSAGRGHHVISGTPEQVADVLEDWYRSGACEGFAIMGAEMPRGLSDFTEMVLPILKQRGLFLPVEEGMTLSEGLGIHPLKEDENYHYVSS